mmetsp:Transcript_74485/g.129140  ORF Transcript_74485/g.129140 Transcript_74485/m.129140 type:complete len:231 (-) Transcript_74485:56-748(-)
MIRSIMDDNLRKKVIFADRGDWASTACLPKTLNPAVLPLWAQHVESHEWKDGWQRLSSASCPMAVSALYLQAGQKCSWRVFFVGGNEKSRVAVLRIATFFFEDNRQPSVVSCCPSQELQASGARVSCEDSYTAAAAGVVLVQADLTSKATAEVAITLVLAGRDDSVQSQSRLLRIASAKQSQLPPSQSVNPSRGALPRITMKQFAALLMFLLVWLILLRSCWSSRRYHEK